MFKRLMSGVLLFLHVFLLPSSRLFAQNSEQTKGVNFLVLTDIHFDPFSECKKINQKPCKLIKDLQSAPASDWQTLLAANDHTIPTYRYDTDQALLASTLNAAKLAALQHQVAFVLVLGDFLAHEFHREYKRYAADKSPAAYQAFVQKTLAFLTANIAEAFPEIDVYALVGNNDSYRGDYYTEAGGKFFQDTSVLWARLIKHKTARIMMQQTFARGAGYYALTLPGQPNIRLVMLNSVLFSVKARGKHIQQAVQQEMNWLHQELYTAKEKNQSVLMAMHIPEGVDVVGPFRVKLFRLMALWRSSVMARYQTEIERFAPIIVGVFTGHLHKNWSQIHDVQHGKDIPVYGTTSVSPIFGNNPGFKIYHYDMSTRNISDAAIYSYSMTMPGMWQFSDY